MQGNFLFFLEVSRGGQSFRLGLGFFFPHVAQGLWIGGPSPNPMSRASPKKLNGDASMTLRRYE